MEPSKKFFPRDHLENLIKVYENNIYEELLTILLKEDEPKNIQDDIFSYIENHKRIKPKDKVPSIERIKNSIFFKPDFLKIKPLINLAREAGIEYLTKEQFLKLNSILENDDSDELSAFFQKNIKDKDRRFLEGNVQGSSNIAPFLESEISKILAKFGINYLENDEKEELKFLLMKTNSNSDLTNFVRENFYEDYQLEIEKALQSLLKNSVGKTNQLSERSKKIRRLLHAPKKSTAKPRSDISSFKKNKIAKNYEEFIYDKDLPEDKDLPRLCPYEFPNKAVYEGQWKNGNRHGQGKQFWPDGSIYEGYWKNDMRDRKGRYFADNGDVYEGKWRNGDYQGYGVYVYKNGDRYRGTFFENKGQGYGEFDFINGKKYSGEWRDDEMNGYGLLKWPNGSTYEGEVNNGRLHGHGVLQASDQKYVGNFKDDKKNGKGILLWNDGRKYIGNFINDHMEGYGFFSWPDGSTYRGNWKGDLKDGKGVYMGTDKEEVEEEWSKGNRIEDKIE